MHGATYHRGVRIHIERFTGYKCRGSGAETEFVAGPLDIVLCFHTHVPRFIHWPLPLALNCSVQHTRVDGVDVQRLHAGGQFLPLEAQIRRFRGRNCDRTSGLAPGQRPSPEPTNRRKKHDYACDTCRLVFPITLATRLRSIAKPLSPAASRLALARCAGY